MAGTITSLGLGSGLDLQNILDQLKEVDRSAITRKENEKQNQVLSQRFLQNFSG
jgi:flagellar hook-associated protein 2